MSNQQNDIILESVVEALEEDRNELFKMIVKLRYAFYVKGNSKDVKEAFQEIHPRFQKYKQKLGGK